MSYQHLYIYKSSDNTFKYGIYNNDRHERIIDGQTYYKDPIELLALFKIYKLPNYNLYLDVDCIISRLCRKPHLLKNINIKFEYLHHLCNGLINNKGAGTEHCKLAYLDTFISAINVDYSKLNLYVEQYTPEQLTEVNDYLADLIIQNYNNNESKYDDEHIAQLLASLNTNYILSINDTIQPHIHQSYILWNCLYRFLRDKKGLLLWSCGLGKTIMALLICGKFQFKNILIGLPSKNLVLQWNEVINNSITVNNNKLEPILCYNGSTNYHLLKTINTRKVNIVLTTYHSSYKLIKICNDLKFKFDIKIGDEAHHLVTNKKDDSKATFDKFHLIPSEYELYMTATQKNMITNSKTDIYNMNNTDIYGNIIDCKSVKWAIDNNKITDYKIVCVYNQDDHINELMNKINIEKLFTNDDNCNKKELFMSAYYALKSIDDNLVSHILIYTNKCQSALIIRKIIDILIKMKLFSNISNAILNNASSFYNKELYSNNTIYHKKHTIKQCNTCKSEYKTIINNVCNYETHNTFVDCQQDTTKCIYKCNYVNDNTQLFHTNCETTECEICKFKKAKYGIISCVYIFGEGFDLPCLNGVVIGEKMTSEIRIVQSCLRPNRLNKDVPNKLAYIIIPINIENISETNTNSKLLSVIKEMGMCDDAIEQKIKLVDITKRDQSMCCVVDNAIKLRNNKRLLSKLLLVLYSRNCFGSLGLSLSKEYDLCKTMIKGKYRTVYDYINSNDIDIIKHPNIHFGKYWEGWYTYLDIDTSRWIPNLSDWINYCKNKNILSSHDYKCNLDDTMPLEPEYFYSGFTNFENELNIHTTDFYLF